MISLSRLHSLLLEVDHVVGQHLAAFMDEPEGMMHVYKWLVGAQLVYVFNIRPCPISGISFYAHLNQIPRFTLFLRISFAFVTILHMAQTLIIALRCVPLGDLWGVEGKCMGSVIIFISTSGLAIACDLLVLLLPMNIIFLAIAKSSKEARLGACTLHGDFVGSLVLFVGNEQNEVVIIYLFGAVNIERPFPRMVSMIVALRHPDGATWYFSVVMAWSATEISSIIPLSLPALRAWFRSEQKLVDDEP
ncbi:hypothetical protein N7517_011262 [Penicillium concentricum]|uniref:Rhodopsin domain-containing protein n=1 Tax=Penicillium concentricum TaxID=293559 RepID=A0A9W9RFM2_9EURO|nr:uncharacterized protein N7517_011262 [Penicillium concentricum]KAJ5356653.1 hypothetical protein N7517_011262 [Penicillium concentricum]